MKKHSIRFGAFLAVVALVVMGAQFIVHAQTSGGSLTGWAWSSNVGFASASSTDVGAGGGPYGVIVDSSGNLVGYLWSSNIGWIKFGGLSGQSVDGMTTSDAHVNLSTGAVTGWARACSGTASGNCSTMTSRTDGWDGWIELSGANHATGDTSGNSGVTFNPLNGQFVGYAWGSDVVGWMTFAGISLGGYVPPNNANDFTIQTPAVSFYSGYTSTTTTIIVSAVSNTSYNPQTVTLSSFTGSSDLTIGSLSTSTCSLPTQGSSCSISLHISLNVSVNNASPSYTITGNGNNGNISKPANIPVTVSTGNCPGCNGGGNPISFVTCNLNLPSGNQSSPYSLTISTNSPNVVTVTGGTPPYTYLWSVGPYGNFTSATNYTLSDVSGDTTYSIYGEAQDSVGSTTTSVSCGTVRVVGSNLNNGVLVPMIWHSSGQLNYLNSLASSSIQNVFLPAFTAQPGTSPTINYALPSGITCTGVRDSGPNPLTDWTGSSFASPSGSVVLHTLGAGVYVIHLSSCHDNATPPNSVNPSNHLEIDVSTSSIHEN